MNDPITDPITVPRELLEDIRHWFMTCPPHWSEWEDYVSELDRFLPKGQYIKPVTKAY